MADLHLAESTGVKLPPPPTPISRPALTAQAPLTQETFPYILPDLPRSSVAATTGYFGIFFGVLVLLIAAIFIVEKLKPDWIEFVPFLPELLDMLPPQVTTYGLITASGCGVYSMAAFIGGIGVLKEKRWARILMWLLGLGAVSILILLGAYIVDPNIISHLLSALTSGQPEPNVI